MPVIIGHIYRVGGLMIVAAAIGLFAGMAGGRYGAKASAGLAREPPRESMFGHIQTFSFAEHRQIQHGRSCHTSDHRCNQHSERLPDDAPHDDACSGEYGLCS